VSRARIGLAVGLAAIALQCLYGLVSPGLGWDFVNFYDAGHKLAVGQLADLYDPHAPIAGQPPQGEQPFRGAPISAWLYAPLARLSPAAALVAFKLQSAVALCAALWLLWRVTRGFAGPEREAQLRFAALFALAAAAFQPFWTVFHVGGQTTPLVFLLGVSGLVLHAAGRSAAAGLCLASAVVVKPGFAPALAFVFFAAGARFRVAVLALGAVLGLVSLAALGWPIHEEYLRVLAAESSNLYRPHWNSGAIGWVDWLVAPPETGSHETRSAAMGVLITALRLGFLAGFAWLALDARRAGLSGAARRALDFQLGLLCALAVMPVVWAHYLALVFPLIAYGIAVRGALPPLARATLAAVVLASVGQHLALIRWLDARIWFNEPYELVALGLFKAVPLVLVICFVVVFRGALRTTGRAPAWQAIDARAAASG
jgi:hypothetical protein